MNADGRIHVLYSTPSAYVAAKAEYNPGVHDNTAANGSGSNAQQHTPPAASVTRAQRSTAARDRGGRGAHDRTTRNGNNDGVSWPVRHDDFFPYADCPHCYWTGVVSACAVQQYPVSASPPAC